jgi:ABC-2 type transport system ATP-binding protein
MLILLGLGVVAGVVYWISRGDRRGAGHGADPVAVLPHGRLVVPVVRRADGGKAGGGRIVVAGLSKRYGAVQAVHGLSFVVKPGRVTGLLGPNGAGKTTTLRMILGLTIPTAGAATIGGRGYPQLGRPARQVGAVLEASAAHPGRTGRDHLRVLCKAAGIPRGRVAEVLALVGLTTAADRKVKGYSLGMRQRLGIAAALMGDPRVLILDEPANGLDPEGIRWTRELLTDLAAAGRTVLVSSHLLAEMQVLADDLIIIAGGRLVAQGTVASVVGSVASTGRTLVRADDLPALTAALGGAATVTPAGDGAVYITGVDADAIGQAARRAGVALHQLATDRPDLEDVFLALTKPEAQIR